MKKTQRLALNIYVKSKVVDLYQDLGINPDDTAIVLALEQGKRIPLSREYDNDNFDAAIRDLAAKLDLQGIHIDNLLSKPYKRQSVHHFETLPRGVADDLESVLYEDRTSLRK